MSVRDQGFEVIRMSLGCLIQQMGLEDLSEAEFEQTPTRHLLRGLSIDRKNQVWRIDITYLRMGKGFMYLFNIIDWYSRMCAKLDIRLQFAKPYSPEYKGKVERLNGTVQRKQIQTPAVSYRMLRKEAGVFFLHALSKI